MIAHEPRPEGCGTGSRDTAQAGRPGLRGLRAAVFAVVCVLAALGMHVLAGGPIIGLGTVVAATAATGAGAFALARRRRSLGTLLTASFAAQYGMHQLFTAGALTPPHHHTTLDPATTGLTTTLDPATTNLTTTLDPATTDLTTTLDPATTGLTTGLTASVTTGVTTGVADHHGGGLYGGIGMLLAHVVVAAVSAWWLDRGETALAALLRLLACSLHDLWALLTARATALAALPLRVPAPVSAGPADVLTSQVLAWALCRRGPPR